MHDPDKQGFQEVSPGTTNTLYDNTQTVAPKATCHRGIVLGNVKAKVQRINKNSR